MIVLLIINILNKIKKRGFFLCGVVTSCKTLFIRVQNVNQRYGYHFHRHSLKCMLIECDFHAIELNRVFFFFHWSNARTTNDCLNSVTCSTPRNHRFRTTSSLIGSALSLLGNELSYSLLVSCSMKALCARQMNVPHPIRLIVQ